MHLRALVNLYSGSVSAPRADEPPASATSRIARGARAITADWMPLGRMMAERRGDVHLDELEKFAKRMGMPFERGRIRQQMHNWKNGKLVVSPAQSVFRLTEAGIAVVDEDDGADSKGIAPRNTEPPDDDASGGSDVVGTQANGRSDFFTLANTEHSRGGT